MHKSFFDIIIRYIIITPIVFLFGANKLSTLILRLILLVLYILLYIFSPKKYKKYLIILFIILYLYFAFFIVPNLLEGI